jgi:hypothetical protein
MHNLLKSNKKSEGISRKDILYSNSGTGKDKAERNSRKNPPRHGPLWGADGIFICIGDIFTPFLRASHKRK